MSQGNTGKAQPGWWTKIPDSTEFLDAFAAMRDGTYEEPKDPCVLCGFDCDLSKTSIFANQRGPRGQGSAHLWCSHILAGAERDRLYKLLKGLVEAEDQPCRFDHHDYCQEHGWFGEPGECYTRLARDAVGLP